MKEHSFGNRETRIGVAEQITREILCRREKLIMIFQHFLRANFFMLFMSNHAVFLVQFGINLHLK